MGLLTIPKKYNPPGNGKRDMEYPIFATKDEQRILKARGGAGKMTRHGLLSFGLGDRGNAVGSAGGSNYSGDGRGGQVNMDHVGGNTGNVLRNIAGKWTVVSKSSGQPMGGSAAQAPVRAVQPIVTPIPIPRMKPAVPNALPPGFMGPASSMSLAGPSPQIGGTNPAAMASAMTRSPVTNAVALDPSIAGRNEQARRNEMTGPGGGVQGGQGVVGYESGPARAPTAPSGGFQSSLGYQDPMAVSRPGSYAGPKGALSLNDAARMAVSGGGTPTNVSNADVTQLAKMMEAESGSIRNSFGMPSTPALQAVGSVVQNRMLDRNQSLNSVLTAPKQFSPSQSTLAGISPSIATMDIARAVLSGQQPSNVGSAMNYANINTINNTPGYSSAATKAAFNAMDPVATFADYKNPNTFSQTFGTQGVPASEVMASQPSRPTMVAANSPPAQQPTTISDVPAGSWMDMLPGAGYAKQAVNYIDETVVKPTQEQVAKYGGFERAGKLAQMAVAMSKFMPGGSGAPLGSGGQERGRMEPANSGQSMQVASATPPVTPPVNPAAEQLYYPQYTQTWANLPTGSYGTAWRPKPPSEGLFDTGTKKKKKEKTKKTNQVGLLA